MRRHLLSLLAVLATLVCFGRPAAAQQTDCVHNCGGGSPPVVFLDAPASLEVTTQYPSLEVEFCAGTNSLNASSRLITVNGVDKTSSFSYTSGDPLSQCEGDGSNKYSGTSSVALSLGPNTLYAYICDAFDTCASNSWTINYVVIGAPTITLRNQNGDNADRGLCLTFGAGQAAGIGCGDLFVAHGMPAYRTKGRDRAFTLLYGSHEASPRPAVAAVVSQPTNGGTPNSVFARLSVGGTVRDSATWTAIAAGSPRQIVLAFDAAAASLSTGIHAFSLLVRNSFSGGNYDTTSTGELLVVNRSASVFGSGWWPSGVEQLVVGQSANRVLWVGGDGSAAVYDSIAAATWRRASGAYRDTLRLASSVYTRSLRHGISVQYDAAGYQIRTINRAQDTTRFWWSGSPVRLDSVRVPSSGSTATLYRLRWDGNAKLDSIIDPAGRALDATVSSGNLTQLTDPDGQYVQFAYDGSHRLTRRTGRRGYGTSYQYANELHVTRVRVPLTSASGDSATSDFAWWDERGLAIGSPGGTQTAADTSSYTRVDGPRGGVADSVLFWVDRWGAPLRIIGAASDTTLVQRSGTTGLVSRLETPVHQVWGMSWDSRGNLLTQNDSTHEGHGTGGFETATTRYTYHSANTADAPDSIIDPEGAVTRFIYNAIGLDSVALAATGQQTRFAYGSSALRGLLTAVIELSVPTYSDTTSWSTPSTSNLDDTTSFAYNALGNDSVVTSPIGAQTRYHYNGYAQVDTVTNALGQKTAYARRPVGVVDSVTQVGSPANRTVRFTYDNDFNRLTVADPRFVTRTWAYDAAGRDTVEINDSTRAERRYFGPSGLLDSVRTRRDSLIRHSYDAAGRLTLTRYPKMAGGDTALGDSITAVYDAASRVTTARNRNGAVYRQYYREGTLKEERDSTGAGSTFHVINRYRYDHANARTWYANLGAAGGSNDTLLLAYAYTSGLLDRIVIDYPGSYFANDTAFYQWDALGRRSQAVTPGKSTMNWYYDHGGRLRRVRATHSCPGGCATDDSGTVDLRYKAYDLLDRPLSVAQYVGQGVATDSQAYDDFGQMQYQVQDGTRGDYTYDLSGNMVSQLHHGSGNGTVYVTPAGHNFLAADTSVSGGSRLKRADYRYDRNFNRMQDLPANGYSGRRDLWYDAAGRMTSIASVVTSSFLRTPDMLVPVFQGDAFPAAPIDSAWVNTATYTAFVNSCRYDAVGRQIKPCGGLAMAFDGHQVVRVAGTRIVYGPSLDDPIVAYDSALGAGNPHLYYPLSDGGGRLLSFTDRNGYDQRIGQYNYAVYSDRVAFSGAIVRGRRFTAAASESYASEDLSFFRNRYYDQRTGRWTQEDPAGIAGGVNLFTYVGNNPATFTDPFGLCPPCIGVLAGEVAGGVAAAGAALSVAAALGAVSGAALDAVDAARDNLQVKFVTYTRTSAAGQVYSGRTSGFGDPQSIVNARVSSHPERLQGFGPAVVDNWAQGAQGYAAIRGREQQLIDAHGGAQSEGGTSGNLIRGVSKANPLGEFFDKTATATFGPVPHR